MVIRTVMMAMAIVIGHRGALSEKRSGELPFIFLAGFVALLHTTLSQDCVSRDRRLPPRCLMKRKHDHMKRVITVRGCGGEGVIVDGIGVSIGVGRLSVEDTARSPASPVPRDVRRRALRVARAPGAPRDRRSRCGGASSCGSRGGGGRAGGA